ncbi:ribonuclease Z [[Eubacterium] cellulosolvens]
MELLFLGTGGSWPCKEYNVPAIAVKLNNEILLFDCGEGTQRQFMISKYSFMRVTKIFITHYHGDHFLGLSGLIQSMNLNNRTEDLNIYGPRGTINTISTMLNLGYFGAGFEITLHDMKNNEVVTFGKYDVKAFDVDHGVPTLGYVLQEHKRPGKFNLDKAKKLGIPKGPLYRKLQSGKTIELNGKKITPAMVLGPPRPGRKIVYSGDTKPCQAVVKNAANADVLIHDACLDSSLEEKALAYGHSTAKHAAEVAKTAKAKVLFLIHHSPRYKDMSILEDEAKKIFKMSFAAVDFLEYVVKYPVK